MHVKTFYRVLRHLSAVVLFFFIWTFGPVWQAVAFAATSPKADVKAQTIGKPEAGKQKTAERFEGILAEMREKVTRASEKHAKGEDDSVEREALRAGRASIDQISEELRAEFSSTEKRLKAAGLPKTILTRHASFVAHFEKNVKELHDNLDGIESAKTKAGRGAKIEKARLHLEKTRSQRHYTPLNPNQLPNRNRKATKTREPRLRKDEYERDFPKQHKTVKMAELQTIFAAYPRLNPSRTSLHEEARTKNKPVQLAFNGSDSDIPFSLGAQVLTPQFTLADTSPFLLAQATVQLSTDDLAETPDIQFTTAILAKAQELGNNPVTIYEWVRNNIEFVPTYGSIQGADMCLQSKQCNDFDTASLLIALLRVSGIYAHYSYGTIEIPIDKVRNWTGGFADAASALNFIASGGVPITGLRSGGIIYAVRMEHVWVRAFVDYIPSMGAVHKQGDTWIPLDASYKQYAYSEGVDFQTVVPFDGQTLANQIKTTATINEQEGSVTNVSSTLIQTAQSDYNAQLDNYVTQNLPNATLGDILGKKEIIKKEQPILPASLPYKVLIAGTETSEIPDQLRHMITVQLTDADNPSSPAFTYTASLPQLAGKRFTVSYDPATSADQATINKYLEQYATSMPSYLVQLKPVLKIEGITVSTGSYLGMGNAQDLSISITSPKGTEFVTHSLLAGDYTAIGLNPSKISLDVFQNRVNKKDFSEPVGEMLHQTALSYWVEADAFNDITAKTLRVNNFRHPSELSASAKVSISYVWGVPSSATYNRRNIDVKFDNQTVFSKTADKTKELYYMQQSGVTSSFLEGAIMDQLFEGNIGDSISAVTAMQAANVQGIPIYKIDSSNITMTLPKLQVADTIKTEISNAVNAGLTVQIPQANITQSGWTGVGYIVSNATDATGAYRISGGLNGGDNSTGMNTVAAIPAVPIDGPIGYVVGAIAANGSRSLGLQVVGGVLRGFVLVGEAAAGVASGAAEVMAVIAIIVLIVSIIQSLLDKLPPRYEKYRKYTTVYYAMKDWIERKIDTGNTDFNSGDLIWPGIYITDLTIEPTTLQDRINIATILRIPKSGPPDPTAVTAYIDLLIDRNRVGLVSFQFLFPHQFLYPHIPMWEDGVRIKFIGIGPGISQ